MAKLECYSCNIKFKVYSIVRGIRDDAGEPYSAVLCKMCTEIDVFIYENLFIEILIKL